MLFVAAFAAASHAGACPGPSLRVMDCGIFGIFKHRGSAAVEIYEALLMLQHRGQDSAGIVCYDGNRFRERKVWHAMLASCYK
jgi:glutamine phosphoribosylpyrophosphate amidotransferase